MNMTSNPNQQNRPNIFGQDFNYPLPNSEWNQYSMNCYSPPNFPFCSNFGSDPVTFPLQPIVKIQQPLPTQDSFDASMFGSSSVFPSTSQSMFGSSRIIQQPLRCKRKTESPTRSYNKQHITEEKMAEHLSKLHISSETAASNEPVEGRTKRLYMCEEMRKLQAESILPASLLNKIQRPCTALVLWQPPQPLVLTVTDNNNEEEVPDNNLMDLDSR